MKYVKTVVFAIRELKLPEDAKVAGIPVLSTDNATAVLTYNPDMLCLDADTSRVIGDLLLAGLFCMAPVPHPSKKDEFAATLAVRLGQLRDDRRHRLGDNPSLVIQITGELAGFMPDGHLEFDDFVLGLQGIPKQVIRETTDSHIAGVVAALHLTCDHTISLHHLNDSTVFYREDGKVLYAYNLSGSATVYVSKPVTTESLGSIGTWYPKLVTNSSLGRVVRLLASSVTTEGDMLRSFLAAWTALEIFVNKVFGGYEDRLFRELTEGPYPDARREHLARMREVMKDKYRLADKFAIISCQLCPNDADQDLGEFRKAKKLRDDLSHGTEVIDSALPVAIVQALIRKYLRLHLA